MIQQWNNDVDRFLDLAHSNGVRMLMVGGGAVNFHGYQRHSADLDVELITKFNVGKTFNQSYEDSEEAWIGDVKIAKFRILSLEDLISSKIKSNRAKDLLDVQELKRINGQD